MNSTTEWTDIRPAKSYRGNPQSFFAYLDLLNPCLTIENKRSVKITKAKVYSNGYLLEAVCTNTDQIARNNPKLSLFLAIPLRYTSCNAISRYAIFVTLDLNVLL